MIAALRLDELHRQRHPLARRKPASGGPNRAPRRRLSRWPVQPTDAPRKNALRYDSAWRGAPMPQNDERCPAVPSPGLGQRELDRRVNATAFRARVRNSDFFSIPSTDNRLELFLKSVPGARNDTKSYVRGSAEYGNFLFGAEAAAAGLSLQEALDWGANAQVVQDLAKFRLPTGSDNPGDAAAVARGHNYYRAGCSR